MEEGLFLIQCLSVTKRRQLKIKAPDPETAMERARQYFAVKYKEYVVVNVLAGSNAQTVHKRLADLVTQGYSQRYNCETESGAAEIATLVRNDLKAMGLELNFDAWAIGKAVHVFPVYYEMRGSINHIERTQPKEERYGIQ